MENNELIKLWKTVDISKEQKTEKELMLLLKFKARSILYKHSAILIASALISLVIITLLIIASFKRFDDSLFIINNIVLGIITLISLIFGISSWYRLQKSATDKPVKIWLKEKITLLKNSEKSLASKLPFIFIPFIYFLTVLSIHVYFENIQFADIFKDEESVFGLLVGATVGLFVSFYVFKKIKKQVSENLAFLEKLYGRL